MEKPSPQLVRLAITVYVKCAYSAEPPRSVQAQLDELGLQSDEQFYDSGAFERSPAGHPQRLSLRIGNRCYPHMKLVIEDSPVGEGSLFRVDTHDRHACPEPGNSDYEAFRALMAQNEAIAQAVESGWAGLGLPTFKQLLRQDLARRRQPGSAAAAGASAAEEAVAG